MVAAYSNIVIIIYYFLYIVPLVMKRSDVGINVSLFDGIQITLAFNVSGMYNVHVNMNNPVTV